MFPLAVVFIYLILKLGFTQSVESLGEYVGYIVEAIMVMVLGFYYRKRLNFKFNFKDEAVKSILPGLIAGFGFYVIARIASIPMPFDFTAIETLVFLLLIGPILEELIFRMALWFPILDLGKRRRYAVVGTSLLFSYAHFHAYWFVPPAFFTFIYYQSFYTILLGFYCAYRLVKINSLASPILVHMGFNLGFFIGSLV